ncbi:MAG: glycosyltransferase [Candidatus Woesearchaeota archaeon]
MKDFKDKTLLVISLYYPYKNLSYMTFVKNQIDEVSKYFKKVIVISPLQFFPSCLTKFNIFPGLYRDLGSMKNYKYDNVEVYFPRYFTLPINFFRNKNGDFAYKATLRCLKKNNIKFDLIHSHFTWPSGYVGVRLKEKFGKKLIVHSRENKGWLDKLIKSDKGPKIWSKADNVVRVNKADILLLKKYNKNSITIYNGVDTSKFKILKSKRKIKEDLDFPLDKKIILNVGNLRQKHKNQLTLLKAVKSLRLKRKDFICILVGEGEDRTIFENYISKHKMSSYVKLLGRMEHNSIPKIMNASDIFAFPSFFEGNPNVFFESQACGLPYVGTDVGDVGSIIKKDTGLILEKTNSHTELCDLLNKALNKKWNFKIISHSVDKFDVKKQINKLLRLY